MKKKELPTPDTEGWDLGRSIGKQGCRDSGGGDAVPGREVRNEDPESDRGQLGTGQTGVGGWGTET